MSQWMKGRHGNTEDSSSADSLSRINGRSLLGKTAVHVMTRIPCLVLYGISWRCLCSLCRYGRLRRNLPILAVCLLCWLGVIAYGLWRWRCYERRKCPIAFCGFTWEGGYLTLRAEGGTWKDGRGKPPGTAGDFQGDLEPRERRLTDRAVSWYIRREGYCQLFLKNGEVLLLNLRDANREDRDLLDLKLSPVGFMGKGAWRLLASVILLAVTLRGGALVAWSATPYNGKLAWYLQDLQDKRTVTLRHDNLYETGVEGVLEDIRRKVRLPETLCLATSFNLHFAPDGRILTLDTMLYGFDRDGGFVDSYLISYHAGRSGKMTIYLHGAADAAYDPDKDLAPLVEAVDVMPLEETVSQWQGEECFGILYYGVREWWSREGVRILDQNGSWRPMEEGSDSGYTISVFCPEREDAAPVRYLYTGAD